LRGPDYVIFFFQLIDFLFYCGFIILCFVESVFRTPVPVDLLDLVFFQDVSDVSSILLLFRCLRYRFELPCTSLHEVASWISIASCFGAFLTKTARIGQLHAAKEHRIQSGHCRLRLLFLIAQLIEIGLAGMPFASWIVVICDRRAGEVTTPH